MQLLAGAIVPVTLGILGLLYRRFRATGSDEVEQFSRYLTQGVKYYVGRAVRRQLAGELTLRQYARVNLTNTATKMMVPATYPVTLETDKVFVPLLLRDSMRATVQYHDLVKGDSARFVVVGEPGSGKSSLMKRTFRDACRKATADPRHAPMPVLFELRNLSHLDASKLAALTHVDLFEHCTGSVQDAAAYKARRAVEDLQHGGGFLLLLDGLDEVPRDASEQVVRAITELGESLGLAAPKSSMIISTRTQHYVSIQDRHFKEMFQPLQIRPFSVADVYRFLLNWPFKEERSQNITRLFSRIRQLPSLTEMCTNPLALSMFVARDQQTEGTLPPETRSEFYASLVDELLVNRRFRREQGAVGRQRLRKMREKILGPICLSHLLDPDEALNSISEERMLTGICDAGHSQEDAHEILETLSVDTGLFSAEREGETYRFMHLTLCEFLAARAVINAGDAGWGEIADRLAQSADAHDDWASRLGEVVTFAGGLAPDSLNKRIAEDLTACGDGGLLLRTAIETQNYNDAQVISAIEEEASSIADVGPGGWKVEWFSRLRWLLAVLRDVTTADQIEFHMATLDDLPTPSSFLVALIDRYGAAEILLPTLARNDSDAALAIAEDSGREDLMDTVVTAADDFSVLLGILARCEQGKAEWSRALVHGALYERSIAEVLSVSRERIGPAPANRKWELCVLLRDSVYGRLLDEVLDTPDRWRDDDIDVLGALSRVKPPRHSMWLIWRGSASAWTGVLLFMTGIIVVNTLLFAHSFFFTTAILLAGVVLVFGRMFASEIPDALTRFRLSRAISQVQVGPIALKIEGTIGPKAVTGSSIRGHRRPDRITTLWRRPVLEEVLNLAEFRFAAADRSEGDSINVWVPSTASRALTGVHEQDIDALLATRHARESLKIKARKVAANLMA